MTNQPELDVYKIVRPVRGCATHEQYIDLVNSVEAVIAYVRALEAENAALIGADITELMKNALQESWNEICGDTGAYPLDIEPNFEGRVGHLGFTPGHWVQRAGALVCDRLRDLLSLAAQGPGKDPC